MKKNIQNFTFLPEFRLKEISSSKAQQWHTIQLLILSHWKLSLGLFEFCVRSVTAVSMCNDE